MFVKPNIEGLIKEFFLLPNCRKNLSLAKLILFRTMTFQDWELPPQEGQSGDGSESFCMPKKLKQDIRGHSRVFFRDFL
jgi:hypothetical protein